MSKGNSGPKANQGTAPRKPPAQQHRSGTDPQGRPSGRPGRTIRFSRSLVAFLGFAAAVVGIVTGALALRSDVSIEPDISANQNNPLATYFRFENNGQLSIYDVTFFCEVRSVRISGNRNLYDNTLEMGEVAELEHGESSSKECNLAGPPDGAIRFKRGNIEKADIVVTSRFRPAWWFWTKLKHERFVAVADVNHVLHWTHQDLMVRQ